MGFFTGTTSFLRNSRVRRNSLYAELYNLSQPKIIIYLPVDTSEKLNLGPHTCSDPFN